MRTFKAIYTTSAGRRGTLTVIARTSCDALIQLLEAIPDARRLSVRAITARSAT